MSDSPRLHAIDQSLFDRVAAVARERPRLRMNHNLHQESDLVQRFRNVLQPGTYVQAAPPCARAGGNGLRVLSGAAGGDRPADLRWRRPADRTSASERRRTAARHRTDREPVPFPGGPGAGHGDVRTQAGLTSPQRTRTFSAPFPAKAARRRRPRSTAGGSCSPRAFNPEPSVSDVGSPHRLSETLLIQQLRFQLLDQPADQGLELRLTPRNAALWRIGSLRMRRSVSMS